MAKQRAKSPFSNVIQIQEIHSLHNHVPFTNLEIQNQLKLIDIPRNILDVALDQYLKGEKKAFILNHIKKDFHEL